MPRTPRDRTKHRYFPVVSVADTRASLLFRYHRDILSGKCTHERLSWNLIRNPFVLSLLCVKMPLLLELCDEQKKKGVLVGALCAHRQWPDYASYWSFPSHFLFPSLYVSRSHSLCLCVCTRMGLEASRFWHVLFFTSAYFYHSTDFLLFHFYLFFFLNFSAFDEEVCVFVWIKNKLPKIDYFIHSNL